MNRDGKRRPRILFLADRNILADQAFNSFSAFPEDAMVRIKPKEVKKTGKVPTNGSIFFTIFQSFMSGKDEADNPKPYFGEYPTDYFDFIIIDECHRGGANDEGNWRGILEYFSPAVQLGLTATPKRKDNVDTYAYFGEPVYLYSLKEGINDGFLTPFKVKRIRQHWMIIFTRPMIILLRVRLKKVGYTKKQISIKSLKSRSAKPNGFSFLWIKPTQMIKPLFSVPLKFMRRQLEIW
ncbi:Type I restriction-modification system, restriction subunit R (EC [uncultured Gammaproteobacteria bacterium]|nr:Type I restriction-modification system, restriction subunit R (EC [uncultured Gammaproteobacteria bacterium]